MNSNKNIKLVFLIFFIFFFFGFGGNVFGKENSFVTIVNPVRGDEFFSIKPLDPLEGVRYQKKLIDKNNFKATWLLRYDIFPFLKDYFKNNFINQDLGIFLEITPSLAKKAKVSYPENGIFWHDANKIFLSGFKTEERIKLINTVFDDFKEQTGDFPNSVGAWHVDAFSAEYIRKKFGVTGILICADQFGTDGYQIWGGWWGVPYYPSKYNILMPAQTLKNKLDSVVFWWAARDPILGYGGSVNESIYSVQVNDYIVHGLGIDYFKKLLNEYLTNNPGNKFGQLTIGLENDSDWKRIGNGFEEQLEEVSQREKNGDINVLTMADFSEWYRKEYNKTSPPHTIGSWKMTTDYRIGLFDNKGEKLIKDLRIYNENWPEANYLTANPWPSLSLNNPYKIDTIRFGDEFIIPPEKINIKNLIKFFGTQTIPFKADNFLLVFYFLLIFLILCYFLRKNISRLLITVLGSLSLSLVMIKSGLIYKYGMGFWGPNGHDGIWHVALIEQLNRFSFNNPVFSQTRLTNYHLGFDLITAFLHLTTRIPVLNLYFQILPPMMAVLTGVLTYKLVERWTEKRSSAWWATFFVYFGGSWGWLFGKGESMFWANQSISSPVNPPYALSIIIFLFGITKLQDLIKKQTIKNLLFCIISFGILLQIKVYAGIIALVSLLLLTIFSFFFRRDQFKKILTLFLLSGLLGLLIFLPFNFKSASLLVFSPLWFPRTMLADADRVGWFKLENARLAYLNSGKWVKWISAEVLALIIFIFGNIGSRAIALFPFVFFRRNKNKLTPIDVYFLGALAVSLTIPLMFIQKGTSWNTIQFFYYFQFLMSIIAGITVGSFLEKIKEKKILKFSAIAIILILTLPTTFRTLKNDYLPDRPPARISIEELEALKFLKNQNKGTVLSFPFNNDWRFKFSEPKPLYAYETTAYISALSGHETFLEDEMNLEITGFDWKPRRDESNRFFLTADREWGRTFLINNKIKYIYLVKGQKMNLGQKDIEGEKIFENGEVSIFKVN